MNCCWRSGSSILFHDLKEGVGEGDRERDRRVEEEVRMC
jgi:hypothetical protein